MCGIIAYIGSKNVQKMLIQGLQQMEYRGYDSAGIAFISSGKIKVVKDKGSVNNLERQINFDEKTSVGIGHTRWATHGKADRINAHPHTSADKKWAIVHNGIIDNAEEIEKTYLQGVKCVSDTDTERAAELLSTFDCDELTAVLRTCGIIKGSFAFACIKEGENKVYLAKRSSPLYAAVGESGCMAASDVRCFSCFAKKFYSLNDDEIAVMKSDEIEFYDLKGNKIQKMTEILPECYGGAKVKSGYNTIKEIKEIPAVINAVDGIYDKKYLDEKLKGIDLKEYDKVYLIGCGTSYHASLFGAEIFRRRGINAYAVIASEFIVRPVRKDTKVLAFLVSQSGETADVLSLIADLKINKIKTIAVTNVTCSTLARLAEVYLPMCAGEEIAVASTKAYDAELIVFYKLAEYFSGENACDLTALSQEVKGYRLDENLLNKISDSEKVFSIGRNLDYYTALECALKLKEITYKNVNAYPAGELKHGPLALIDDKSLIIAFATDKDVFLKTLNGVSEGVYRGADCVIFTTEKCVKGYTGDKSKLCILKDFGELTSVLAILPMQYCAYEISVKQGINPDKPRNLAKSVTVL